jgi:hypothetical protein
MRFAGANFTGEAASFSASAARTELAWEGGDSVLVNRGRGTREIEGKSDEGRSE